MACRADLDEALDIAKRGAMRLFLADIYLSRARLFGRVKDKDVKEKDEVGRMKDERAKDKDEGGRMKDEGGYPWGAVGEDLGEARGLIEECGYGRRRQELADAEEALLEG